MLIYWAKLHTQKFSRKNSNFKTFAKFFSHKIFHYTVCCPLHICSVRQYCPYTTPKCTSTSSLPIQLHSLNPRSCALQCYFYTNACTLEVYNTRNTELHRVISGIETSSCTLQQCYYMATKWIHEYCSVADNCGVCMAVVAR